MYITGDNGLRVNSVLRLRDWWLNRTGDYGIENMHRIGDYGIEFEHRIVDFRIEEMQRIGE